MLKENLCRATFGLALSAVVCVAGTAMGQDAPKAASNGPVSVRSIRPFVRSEVPANQAPNLYDASSDEFNYFREDLGRQEMSTKQRKRMEQIASRVVYADPMDKPAADGSKFIDIYSLDEVIDDGKPFEGLDDPDVLYADSENNLLAQFADACDKAAQTITLLSGVGATTASSRDANGFGGSGSGAPSGYIPPEHAMPTVTMDAAVMPEGSGPGMGVETIGGPADQGKKDSKKSAGPSKKDDTGLIFKDDPGENPFEGKVEANADFDYFKADRDFAPKAAAPAAGNGMIMGSGGMPPAVTYGDK